MLAQPIRSHFISDVVNVVIAHLLCQRISPPRSHYELKYDKSCSVWPMVRRLFGTVAPVRRARDIVVDSLAGLAGLRCEAREQEFVTNYAESGGC